jgi:hypothetical protein
MGHHRSAGNEEMRTIVPALVLGSALWLLLLAGVAYKETTQSDVRQAAAAHQVKWPERYSKHALDRRRNGTGDAMHAGHTPASEAVPIDSESSIETMLLLGASD